MNRRLKLGAGMGRNLAALAAISMCASQPAMAGLYNDGKVLLTEGVSITDGAAGGGVVPWAVIGGYETRDGINADLHYTFVYLPDYSLNSFGAKIGLYDRLEISYANDSLPTGSTYDTVGLVAGIVNQTTDNLGLGGTNLQTGIEAFNTTVRMNVFGAKLRLFGDAIYNSDDLIPQVAVGGFYKINNNKELLRTLGADKSKDFEVYVAATKIFFPLSTLINITARYTSANQTGLVGFGGPDGNHRKVRFEGSLAYLLNKATAIGGEYAQHGNALGAINLSTLGIPVTTSNPTVGGLLTGLTGDVLKQRESDWRDIFVAFAPSKNFTVVFAYAMLGNIVLTPHQDGFYASFQASF